MHQCRVIIRKTVAIVFMTTAHILTETVPRILESVSHSAIFPKAADIGLRWGAATILQNPVKGQTFLETFRPLLRFLEILWSVVQSLIVLSKIIHEIVDQINFDETNGKQKFAF